MDFDYTLIITSLPVLAQGAMVTLLVSLASIALGMAGGMFVCVCRISHLRWVRFGASLYISAFRGIPILVLLLIVYYILPQIGINTPPLVAAVTGLALNSAAFQAEIYRGGFASIHPGQVEAARALGLSPIRTYRRILIPQVLKKVMPALVNEVIVLLKNSSLISVISVTELMRVSQTLVSSSYRPLEIYLTAALLYLLMNFGLATVGARFSRQNQYTG